MMGPQSLTTECRSIPRRQKRRVAGGEDVGTPGPTSDKEKASFRNDGCNCGWGVGMPSATCTHRSSVPHICVCGEAHCPESCLTQEFPIFSISWHIN